MKVIPIEAINITEEAWYTEWTPAKKVIHFSSFAFGGPSINIHAIAKEIIYKHHKVLKKPNYAIAKEHKLYTIMVQPYNVETFKILYMDTIVDTYMDGVKDDRR